MGQQLCGCEQQNRDTASKDMLSQMNRQDNITLEQTNTIIYKKVTIQAFQGDYTQEDSDCIVCISGKDLDISKQKQNKISLLGGEELQNELNSYRETFGQLNVADVMYTHSGELNCDYVIHSSFAQCMQNPDEQCRTIIKAVQKSLELANRELKLNSIAFPLMKNSFININNLKISKLMFQTIQRYIDNEEKNTLKNIFVIHQDFRTVLQIQNALVNVFKLEGGDQTVTLNNISPRKRGTAVTGTGTGNEQTRKESQNSQDLDSEQFNKSQLYDNLQKSQKSSVITQFREDLKKSF